MRRHPSPTTRTRIRARPRLGCAPPSGISSLPPRTPAPQFFQPLPLRASIPRNPTPMRIVTALRSAGRRLGSGAVAGLDPRLRIAAHRLEQEDGVQVPLPLGARVAQQRLRVEPLRVEHLHQAPAPRRVRVLSELERRLRCRHGGGLAPEQLGVVLERAQNVGDLAERHQQRLPVTPSSLSYASTAARCCAFKAPPWKIGATMSPAMLPRMLGAATGPPTACRTHDGEIVTLG